MKHTRCLVKCLVKVFFTLYFLYLDLQLNNDVEKEENRLLREQCDSLKKENTEKIKYLTEEVEKVRRDANN